MPLPGPHGNVAADNEDDSLVNGGVVLDNSGLEVCRLVPEEDRDIELLPPVPSDSGTEQGPGTETLEPFNAIVSDLTQILCSHDEAVVIASAQ